MAPRRNGFTLLELIIVITILGILTAMVAPFGAHMDNSARRAATDNTFEAVRAAILGPRGQTDAQGRPVIGGYVGDMGHLPPLYAYEWNDARGRMVVTLGADDDAVISDIPFDPDAPAAFNPHAQPMGLWTAYEDSLEANSTLGAGRAGSVWRGPYLATPRDQYPDDNAFAYATDPRLFLLRETEGRLSDGWGLAFIVLSEEMDSDGIPQSLTFISPGPDGDYDPDDENFATGIDCEKPVNEDNLVYTITRHEYANDAVRIDQTRSQLLALHDAIVGPRRDSQGRQVPPSGYSADVGGLETLFGTLVRHNSRVYLRKEDGTDATWIAGNWIEVSGDADDFPLIPLWREGAICHAPKPYLLHGDSGDIVLDADNITAWQCLKTNCNTAAFTAANGWRLRSDLSFPILEFVVDFDDTSSLTLEKPDAWTAAFSHSNATRLPAWGMADTTDGWPALSFGWRGGYLPPAMTTAAPLWLDAWNRRILVRQDAGRNIHLISEGADPDDSNDDIIVTIHRDEYEQPLTVQVTTSGNVVPVPGESVVDLWAPRNGQLHVWRAWNATATGDTFRFGATAAASIGLPLVPPAAMRPIAQLCEDAASCPASISTVDATLAGLRVPVGQVYLEFRHKEFENTNNTIAAGQYASPHPTLTTNSTTTAAGPAGYQQIKTLFLMDSGAVRELGP
ncbi:type II secretion system protein [Megalodesulfovibrio paquesii]